MAKATGRIKVTTQWKDACDIKLFRLLPAMKTVKSGGDHNYYDDYGKEMKDVKEVNMMNLDADTFGWSLKVDEPLQEISLVHDQEWSTTGDDADADADADADGIGSYLIEAMVPELFSVDLLLGHGSISVSKKMKGDCRINVHEGDIDVGVIRGEGIALSTGSGRVTADELEGKVDIAATKVFATLINGAEVDIDASGEKCLVKIGGLYSSAAQIRSAGDVVISASHGRLKVDTAGCMGAVTLSSVNGTADVSTGEGGAHVHVDVLEEGTNSHVRSDKGDVIVSMSREVHADMVITGNIAQLPPSFEGDIQTMKAVGTINSSETRSSVGVRYSGQDSGQGKIDLAGARSQSLRQFFPAGVGSTARAKLSVSAIKGSIGLETISWADNIARRFTREHNSTEK
eukprot:jgi/Undpi1/3085/HiC_scaffold_15.g06459.m1